MARRLCEMQAKLLQLESLGERVSGLAGINPADIRAKPGQGGALVSGRPLTMEELEKTLADLDRVTEQRTDLMAVVESRLFEQKVRSMMIPTQHPVAFGGAGSGFGWRIDPFTGRSALHTGIDYQSTTGTAILAAAGGVVVTQEFRPDYGNMLEIDHGKDLITRYAHASKLTVKKGDLIKRGQKIGEVGTTGRSTGPHLHFEVLVRGVPQDPHKFMNASRSQPAQQLALAPAAPTVKAPAPVAPQPVAVAVPKPPVTTLPAPVKAAVPLTAPAPVNGTPASVPAASPAKPAAAAPVVAPAMAAAPAAQR